MKYRVKKSFPWNLNVWDLVYIEHPFIKYEKNGVDYKIGINEKDIEEFFVKENKKPMSWEELVPLSWYRIDYGWTIEKDKWDSFRVKRQKIFRPTKELAEAQLALSQLMQLRDSRRDWWKTTFINDSWCPVCIKFPKSEETMLIHSLSFEDIETRDLFQETFSDLIDKIKPLYFS